MLAEYRTIDPNLPERLIAHTERQSTHRQSIEQGVLDAQRLDARQQRNETRLAQVLGFVAVMTCICGGILVTMWGHSWSGGLFGTAGIGGLASAFFFTSRRPPGTVPIDPPNPTVPEKTDLPR